MLPSSSDLQYFLEVANSLNLSRAAERLGISQPSLTLAIQRLETSVGTEVLIRSKKGVLLTQAGKQLLLHTRQLLQNWDQVRARTLASVKEIQGAYTIGCHPSVALYSLPGFLPTLMRQHPALDVRLKHDLSRKITEGVISSSIDVGIVVNPVRHPDLVIQKLCDDEVTLWRAPNGNEKVLLCDPDLIQTQSLLRSLKKKGVDTDRVIASSSLEVIAELTARGCGMGILPGRVAACAPGLRRVPSAPVYSDEICVLVHMQSKPVKAIQTIVGAIKEAFQIN